MEGPWRDGMSFVIAKIHAAFYASRVIREITENKQQNIYLQLLWVLIPNYKNKIYGSLVSHFYSSITKQFEAERSSQVQRKLEIHSRPYLHTPSGPSLKENVINSLKKATY